MVSARRVFAIGAGSLGASLDLEPLDSGGLRSALSAIAGGRVGCVCEVCDRLAGLHLPALSSAPWTLSRQSTNAGNHSNDRARSKSARSTELSGVRVVCGSIPTACLGL